MMEELVVKPPEPGQVIDDISLIKEQNETKSQSITSNTSRQNVSRVIWPEFKVPLPDPELG